MTETWRYVDLGAVDAFDEQRADGGAVALDGGGGRPTLQTSVWGRTHLNVGWFDDVDDDPRSRARANELGVQVIRRPFAGGGTAFYDAGCTLMWGVMFPKGAGHDDLDAEIERVKPIVLDALGRIGLGEVTFRRLGRPAMGTRPQARRRLVGRLRQGRERRRLPQHPATRHGPVPAGRAGARREVQGQARLRHARGRLHRAGGRRPRRSPTRSSATRSSASVRAAGIELVDEPLSEVGAGRARQDLAAHRVRRQRAAHLVGALPRRSAAGKSGRARQPQGQEAVPRRRRGRLRRARSSPR